MGLSAFLDGCRQSLYPFICFYIRRTIACVFGLLQLMNFRHPQKRLAELQTRNGCVITSSVLWRWKTILPEPSCLEDFLLWPSDADLSSLDVLFQQNVSLYCLTSSCVVFVRTAPHRDCYRSETSPFFHMAQFFHAEEVYVTSHHWLDILSTEIAEECRVQVTCLLMTGRCGSTMLCQIMEGVPGTVCIPEPEAMSNVVTLRRSGVITADQNLSLLRSVISILVYHASASASQKCTEHVFIKTRSKCTALIKDINKVWPQMRLVFMYRRLPSYLKSRLRLIAKVKTPMLKLVDSDVIAAMTPSYRQSLFRVVFYGPEEEEETLTDLIPHLSYPGILATMFCSQLQLIQRLQGEGHVIPALMYEDVVADPSATVGRLLDYLHLPRHHLHSALRSMSKPSQGSVPGFEGGGYRITDREWRDVDKVVARFQLPKMAENVEFSQNLSGH